MMARILHNPRCSKSRQALALLEEHGAQIKIIDYLKKPLDIKAIKKIYKDLGLNCPRDMMRKGEAIYKENNLKNLGLNHDDLFSAMAENPILIERPIIITEKGTKIGRPPEAITDIL